MCGTWGAGSGRQRIVPAGTRVTLHQLRPAATSGKMFLRVPQLPLPAGQLCLSGQQLTAASAGAIWCCGHGESPGLCPEASALLEEAAVEKAKLSFISW